MKIKCEYCNSYIDESEEKCPACGAPNKDFKRVANKVPTTIEEFKATFPNKYYPYSKKRLLNKYMINKLQN